MGETAFEEVLKRVDKMSLEDQSIILEILKNRYREKRREEILRNAIQTMEEYRKGLTSRGTVEDLLRSLEEEGDEESDLGK